MSQPPTMSHHQTVCQPFDSASSSWSSLEGPEVGKELRRVEFKAALIVVWEWLFGDRKHGLRITNVLSGCLGSQAPHVANI